MAVKQAIFVAVLTIKLYVVVSGEGEKHVFRPCDYRDSVLRESLAECEVYLKSLHFDQVRNNPKLPSIIVLCLLARNLFFLQYM